MTYAYNLSSISPIDGRYNSLTKSLIPFFSEMALMRYRLKIEIDYFIALCNVPLPQLTEIGTTSINNLKSIYKSFNENDALEIKKIEQTTNHDIKALEYFLKNHFEKIGLRKYKEFIHFALTSQDINNTVIPYITKKTLNEIYLPEIYILTGILKRLRNDWKDIVMLARTHGQAASPTKAGKEIGVFIERIEVQCRQLKNIPHSAKFGGAVGNFNAHKIAFPNVDWISFADNFIDSLGLSRSKTTTQIEHYDNFAALCDCLRRINTILIDLSRDLWMYISMGYLGQKINKNEIGSSAMPHKVNPIDFENAEGNLGIANSIFEHFSAKLPISRLQRDLSDSTVLRNIGVPIAHTIIAFKNIEKGLNKLIINNDAIEKDLNKNWAVVAEGIQTILRREGYQEPYEILKELTRVEGEITQNDISVFIDKLNISPELKKELLAVSPHSYTGY